MPPQKTTDSPFASSPFFGSPGATGAQTTTPAFGLPKLGPKPPSDLLAAVGTAPAPSPPPVPTRQPTVISSGAARQETAVNQGELTRIQGELDKIRETALKLQAANKKQQEIEGKTVAGQPAQPTGIDRLVEDELRQTSQAQFSPTNIANQNQGESLQADITQANSDIDAEMAPAENLLTQISFNLSSANQAAIQDIRRTFDTRRQETRDLNNRVLGAQRVIGIRSGRQRYASAIQTGILASEEQRGLRAIAQLDADELTLVSQAEQANTSKQFEVLSRTMELISDKRRQKNDAVRRLHDLVINEQNAVIARNRELRDQIEFGQAVEDRNISGIAFGTLDSLSGDPTVDFQIISDIADQQGVDTNRLFSAVKELQVRQDKEGLSLDALRQDLELGDLSLQSKRLEIQKRGLENQTLSQKLSQLSDPNITGQEENNIVISALREQINTLDAIIDHPDLGGRVGAFKVTRLDPFRTGIQFAGLVQQFTSEAALNELIAAKARGATFGALSNAELGLLIKSATKLGNWEVKDDNGEGVGQWQVSEEDFKGEITELTRLARKGIGQAGGQGNLDEDDIAEINAALGGGVEEEFNPANFFE